jgi:hypothetical protein
VRRPALLGGPVGRLVPAVDALWGGVRPAHSVARHVPPQLVRPVGLVLAGLPPGDFMLRTEQQ